MTASLRSVLALALCTAALRARIALAERAE